MDNLTWWLYSHLTVFSHDRTMREIMKDYVHQRAISVCLWKGLVEICSSVCDLKLGVLTTWYLYKVNGCLSTGTSSTFLFFDFHLRGVIS